MIPQMQNPAAQGRVSRDLLAGASHFPITQIDWRTQLIAARYSLGSSMARHVLSLHFREAHHD